MHIPINLNEVQESKPVSAGRYDLTIASAEEWKSQKGAPQIKVSIGINGHDEAPNVTHFISLPAEGDDPQKAQFKALFLKRFLSLFKIPFNGNGFSLDDFPGATATAELTLSEPDDSGSVYNRLQLPRLKGESGPTSGESAPKPPKR